MGFKEMLVIRRLAGEKELGRRNRIDEDAWHMRKEIMEVHRTNISTTNRNRDLPKTTKEQINVRNWSKRRYVNETRHIRGTKGNIEELSELEHLSSGVEHTLANYKNNECRRRHQPLCWAEMDQNTGKRQGRAIRRHHGGIIHDQCGRGQRIRRWNRRERAKDKGTRTKWRTNKNNDNGDDTRTKTITS